MNVIMTFQWLQYQKRSIFIQSHQYNNVNIMNTVVSINIPRYQCQCCLYWLIIDQYLSFLLPYNNSFTGICQCVLISAFIMFTFISVNRHQLYHCSSGAVATNISFISLYIINLLQKTNFHPFITVFQCVFVCKVIIHNYITLYQVQSDLHLSFI